jgi:flagellar motor component MotA
MDIEEFEASVSLIKARILLFSERARTMGLLAMEEYMNELRPIDIPLLDKGLKLVINGTWGTEIQDYFSSVVDKYDVKDLHNITLARFIEKGCLMIQDGDDAYTITHTLDAFIKEYEEP